MASRTRQRVHRFNRVVTFRLDEESYTKMAAKIEASGLSTAEFFREAVLKEKAQIQVRTHLESHRRTLISLYVRILGQVERLVHLMQIAQAQELLSSREVTSYLLTLESFLLPLKRIIAHVD